MTQYTKVRSNQRPSEMRITDTSVILASNIVQYTETIDQLTITGYEYDCTIYTKDQYILILAQQNGAIQELQEELKAAKILLGVE